MHAVVINVTIEDRDAAVEALQGDIVPTISALPGFVGGYWVALPGDKGASIAVFESEQIAQEVVDRVQRRGPAVNIDSVEIGEVVAHA